MTIIFNEKVGVVLAGRALVFEQVASLPLRQTSARNKTKSD